MPRLDIDRQHHLEPKRMQYCISQIEALGYRIIERYDTWFSFMHNDYIVRVYPYSGWHTGKSIKDGRGIRKLLKQLNH